MLTFRWFFRRSTKNSTQIFRHALKVLLLPFRAQQDIQSVYVDYQRELEESLKGDSLSLDIKSIAGIDCPKTDAEAEAIAINKNADIVIWGSYVESPQGPKKLRLRYLLIKNFQIPYLNLTSGNKEEYLSYDISNLRKGYLQNDLYYLLHWIEGLSAFNQNDYSRALKSFSALKNDSLLLQQYEFYALDNLAEIFLVLGREEFTFPIFDVLIDKIRNSPEDVNELEKSSIYSKIGVAFGYQGDLDRSIENHLKAISILDNSENVEREYMILKSSIYSNMGIQYTRMTQIEKAEKCFHVCLSLDSILLQQGVDRYEMRAIINNLVNMSNLKLSNGEFDAALKILVDIENKAKKNIDSNDRLWASIYNNKGHAYFGLGDYAQALNYQKKDMMLSEELYDDFHRNLIPTYNNMAVYYEKLDSLKNSLFFQRKAIGVAENNDENRMTNELASLYSNYAISLADDGQFEKSIEYNQKSIDIREQRSDMNTNFLLATSYNNMSYTYRKMQQFDKALIYHKKAIDVSIKLRGIDDIYTGIFYSKMAESYFGNKNFVSALEVIRNTESIYTKNDIQTEHPWFVDLVKLKNKCYSNLN